MFKIHNYDNNTFDQWLPWGGITHEHIVRNKDDSLLAILSYAPIGQEESAGIKQQVFPEFIKGWSFWSDRHHTKDRDIYYVAICWNPFFDKKRQIVNTLSDYCSDIDHYESYFESEIIKIADNLRVYTSCQMLNYQEIYNYLAFTISIGTKNVKMPEIPIYMDVDFSSFVSIGFTANGILIDDKRIVMLSLPSAEKEDMEKFFRLFEDINYRYVRRMLLMSRQDAEADIASYTKKWCPGRESIREVITNSVLGGFNGYYYSSFIFLIDKSEKQEFVKVVSDAAAKLGLVCIAESYNLKDSWWGCIPGCFTANINPPVIGFGSALDVLF